jgi:hypothetical protein
MLCVVTLLPVIGTAAVLAQPQPVSQTSYVARAFNAAHPDLARSAGRGAQLANEDYVRANELRFAADGSLTIAMSHQPPVDSNARANWLPAPDGQFALIVRTYVPTPLILDGSYKLPNVQPLQATTVGSGR